MTIGRIPKVDPGATQPQDRKPSPPAGRAGFKTAPSGKDRVPPKPSQPASGAAFKSTAAPPADDPGVQERGRRGAQASRQACASSNVIPGSGRQRSRIREGILATAGWRIHRVGKTGAKARKQSFAATVASAFGTTPGANDGRLEETASGWSQSPAIQIERTACPAPARGQFEYHDYATVWQAKAGPTIHRSGPGPRRFYAKTRAREYRAVRFAQAQDKWYQDGQVTLTSDIVKTVTADHVRLFPATRRQSNSSTSRSHRKRCWRCESCP